MARIAASRVKAAVLETVAAGERVVVQSKGRDVAALVPLEDLKTLQRLEDEADCRDASEALKGPFRDWEDVKRDLGL